MTDIPITANERKAQFTGNTGLGPFAFTFNILTNSDIRVIKNSTVLTLTSEYTVTTNVDGTGSVTLTGTGNGTALISSDILTIIGNRQLARTSDYVQGGNLFAGALNEDLDSIVIMMQQLDEKVSRTMRIDAGDIGENLLLPSKASRLNRVLQFNASTGDPEAGPTADAVANAQTNATNAAASASAAASSASAASGSASAASSSASAAASSASAAQTAETNAETAETNAETAETNAAASASAAATSETNAASSAAAAAASEAGVAADAAAAASSASAAATSASNAATSETNAANSASAASGSATSAANSAAAAAASFDSFDDRYLGVKASDPTLDNDGNALVAGALYFSSSENIMKVYDGASWIAATSAGNVSFLQYEYTATLGQTTFSGADDNAATLSYTVANLIVTLNGVVLDNGGDYTATNGTSVVLTSGAAAGDLLQVIAFKSFTVADMVPASTGGTFSGNVAVNGNLTVDTNTLFGDAVNNRVGVGTSSPAAKLHVSHTDGATNARFAGASYAVRMQSIASVGAFLEGTDQSEATYQPLVLGGSDLRLATGGSERARIDASGNLLVSTTSTSTSGDNGFKFYPNGSGGGAFATFVNEGLGGTNMYLVNGNASTSSWVAIAFAKQATQVGNISCTTTTTAYNTSSDYRLKEDAQPMTGAVDRVLALKPVNFAWKLTGERVDGFLAHEAQEIVPEAVAGTKDEVDDEGNPKYQGIDQSKLVPLLTAALQEALARIETLEADVAALKGEPA